MREQLNGPCCVLCTAMNFDGAPDRPKEPDGVLFQASAAAVAAFGFILMIILA